MDARDLEPVLEVADVIQIGARNMQNYPLLTEIGRSGRPVLLKRGLSATLEELLMAAEYVLKEGNENVMLCERGIRTFETAYRFTLDLTAVPVLKELTHLPVIVDPSHAAGPARPRRAAVARRRRGRAPTASSSRSTRDPEEAICDGPQALVADDFAAYAEQVERGGRGRRQGALAARSEQRAASPSSASGSSAARSAWPRASGSAREVAASTRRAGVLDARRSSAARSTHGARAAGRGARRRRRRVRRRAGGALPAAVREALAAAAPDCVVTDVGSTKRAVVAAVDDPRFVGGHPLAGAETAGVEHARADLFDGATWYLTPTAAHRGRALRAPAPAARRPRRAPAGDRRRRRTTA